MKLYPLYEFPPDEASLLKILFEFDNSQPVSRSEAVEIVQQVYGKRQSRSKIIVRNFQDLGLLSLSNQKINLSQETQLYLDMSKKVSDLLLNLTFRNIDLFKVCFDICEIPNYNDLSNPKIIDFLVYNMGYHREKLTTAKEKMFALRRLINICNPSDEQNEFKTYQSFIKFLGILENEYLGITGQYYGEAIPLNLLKENIINNTPYSSSQINIYIEKLYLDILLSRNVSFTNANVEFAKMGYFEISKKNYYFIKIFDSLYQSPLVLF
ncbi:hypothetical protein ACFTRD_00605 [Paenibacillus sp. NPDC056933]|uniref:hypothetical protein n=1 Tax=Paenibacillus sp. NPDC056933 TaxID=3345968 RepID=UPI003638AA2B